MLANGLSVENIEKFSDRHWERIDDVRRGDVLVRKCGERFGMGGTNERYYVTRTPQLIVDSICERGYVKGHCPQSHEHGRVEIANYMFEIQGVT